MTENDRLTMKRVLVYWRKLYKRGMFTLVQYRRAVADFVSGDWY